MYVSISRQMSNSTQHEHAQENSTEDVQIPEHKVMDPQDNCVHPQWWYE